MVDEKKKQLSQRAFYDAVLSGEIKRPERCEYCTRRATKIVGHHIDYNMPMAVIFLCCRCHSIAHRTGNDWYMTMVALDRNSKNKHLVKNGLFDFKKRKRKKKKKTTGISISVEAHELGKIIAEKNGITFSDLLDALIRYYAMNDAAFTNETSEIDRH